MTQEELIEIIHLARQLPEKDDQKNLVRLLHAHHFGHILILKEFGRVISYAEVYRMSEPPDFPAIPFPIDDPNGTFLYCYAASCEKGRIKELMNLGHRLFPACRICYHRDKHSNRLYVERGTYAQSFA